MTFNQMIDRFLSILNRDDCTRGQAEVYLQDSMARICRAVRLPNMERAQTLTVSDQPLEVMAMPSDLLEIIDVFVQGLPNMAPDRALQLLPYRELIGLPADGDPRAYGRFQGSLHIRGNAPQGSLVTLLYYGEFSDFTSSDVENEISASNPDLVVYGALSFAADAYDHPSGDKWEERFQSMLGEVQGLAADLDTKGGPTAIQPMYQE